MAGRPGPVLARLLRAPAALYRWHAGWLLGRRFLLLVHAGRRSGRHYSTVVEVIGRHRSTGEYYVLSGFGREADWYRNVLAGGAVEVTVGRERFRPAVRELDEDEAAAVLAGYERRNRLAAPVVRRVLGRLLGRPYRGTDDDRRQAVRQLPVVGFRPA